MGKIDRAVQNGILKDYPELNDILAPFLVDFDISWGAERKLFNSKLYTFIAKPLECFAEIFGFEYELLLVYSPFSSMQARTMQAINSIFLTEPAKGRVENLVCIIVSAAPDAKEWVNAYTVEHQDLRTYVVLEEGIKCTPNHSLSSVFRQQLGERDLFDVQLPLLDDLYFFGRQTILQSIIANIKRCENSGVFGLRKTGKTSLLYKIKRTLDSTGEAKTFIYDAKNINIRMRSWSNLMLLIMKDICNEFSLTYKLPDASDVLEVVQVFEKILEDIPKGKRIVLVIDEIEFISFAPPFDVHWKKDYFHFWQFLWSMQSVHRNICFVIAGVNPQVLEISSIDTVQNPLFSIVTPYYIQGLDRSDIHELARRIGRRMGMRFDHTAVDYLYTRYGGHPLLTRLALSYENQNAPQKPISFTDKTLISDEVMREESLVPYCQHIVDILKDFYPDEYTLLEFLSVGDISDFVELATSKMLVQHLSNYGLLEYEKGVPKIGIPVVSSYIGGLISADRGTQLARAIIPVEQRESWIHNNIKSIISYMRQLEITIRKNGTALLFGSNSFPEADKLLEFPVAKNESGFKIFITALSNCFVESIENYGKSIGKGNYFWEEIKNSYPVLFEALLRIKAYRNQSEHLKLIPKMQETVDRFVRMDLEGKKSCEVNDVNFILQQCTIENLKLAISLEISRLS